MTNLSPSTATLLPSASQTLNAPRSNPAQSKLDATAKEFESVLLTQWLQAAESSFGSVPGADDDQDSGGEQMKSFGVQQLATALSNAGGIGIAKVVTKALSHAEAVSSSGTHKGNAVSR